jgi:exopolysaccharide biosynthesis WecB/TagA/CpsF family protein
MERIDAVLTEKATDAVARWVPFEQTNIGGFQIVTASRAELAAALLADCISAQKTVQRPRLVFDANGHALSLRETSKIYRSAVEKADIIHADGGFLVTLSRWMGQKRISERSATTDMIHDCAKVAAENNLSFYVFGGLEDVNHNCVLKLKEMYRSLRIVGRRSGYFEKDEEKDIIAEINTVQPDVLWVGLGKPLEQVFCARWRNGIKCTWIITCGGCFNYITGDYKRAPMFMQKIHMEWAFRAFSSRRLFVRYLFTNIHAIYILAKCQIIDNCK